MSERDVTHDNVARWFSWLLSQHKSRSTAVVRLMAVRSYYRWLISIGVVSVDPTLGISSRRPHVEPRQPYSLEEMRRLMAAAGPRERSFILFAAGSGCRRAEIFALRIEDMDFNSGLVLIRNGKGGKQRYVAPGARAIRAVRFYIDGRKSGCVWHSFFGRPLAAHEAYKILKELAISAGVAGVTFHRFRVTAANWLADKGMALDELQEVLGHADIATTAHYAAFTKRDRALQRQRKLSLADRLAG